MRSPMRRSIERRSVGVIAWLVGLLAVAAVLVASFALVSPDRLAGAWPMGIRSTEVDGYAKWLDVSFSDSVGRPVPVYYISASGRSKRCSWEDDGRGWERRWLEGEGYGDSVKVRRMRSEDGGLLVELKEGTLLREQRAFVLRPAGPEAIRQKYLEMLATEMGLLTPELTLVRLVSCGSDLGLHLKEEVVDAHFLQRRGMQDGSAFTTLFDPRTGFDLVPVIKGDSAASAGLRAIWTMGGKALPAPEDVGNTVDQRALAAWLLLRWLSFPDDPLNGEHVMGFRWGQRQVVPVYRSLRRDAMTTGPLTTYRSTPITVLLQDPDLRNLFRAAQDELLAKRGQLRERAEAIDRVWVPQLAAGDALDHTLARVGHMRDELLMVRLSQRDAFEQLSRPLERMPGWSVYGGGTLMPLAISMPAASEDHLKNLLRMTKLQSVGDSIIFPRGKYTIAEDLLLPAGTHVVMLPGARLEVAPGRRIVCRGDLHIRGTRINPVFIRPMRDTEPFAGLDVIRDGGGEVRITGLQMSGGGAGGAAMLRVQGVERTAVEGAILDGKGGLPLLWVAGGDVFVTGGTVTGGHLSFMQSGGTLKNVEMRGAARGTGDAGVILDGSRMRIEGGSITRSSGAAVDVRNGAQLLLLGLRCEANTTALLAVDGSLVHVDACRFVDNATVFELRSEKATRGATRLLLYTNEFLDNTRDRVVDARSSVLDGQRLDDKVRRGGQLIP